MKMAVVKFCNPSDYFTICLTEVIAKRIKKIKKNTFAIKDAVPTRKPNANTSETIAAIKNTKAKPTKSILTRQTPYDVDHKKDQENNEEPFSYCCTHSG